MQMRCDDVIYSIFQLVTDNCKKSRIDKDVGDVGDNNFCSSSLHFFLLLSFHIFCFFFFFFDDRSDQWWPLSVLKLLLLHFSPVHFVQLGLYCAITGRELFIISPSAALIIHKSARQKSGLLHVNIQQMAELLIISIMYQYKPATPQ